MAERKRGQGEGSISKRQDGTWWARITIGRDENGKQKRKAFYGRTRKEVQEKLTVALNEVNNDTYIEPSSMTVGKWSDIWLKDYCRPSVKNSTYYTRCYAVEKHVKPMLGMYKLKDLRNDMIQRFINELSETRGLAHSSVVRIYSPLKLALKQAEANGLIGNNPADNVKLPKHDAQAVKVLTLEEQNLFVELAKEMYQGELFILALATGLRRGELLALTWDDIDFDESLLRVNKTQTRTSDYYNKEATSKLVAGTPKTKSSNRIVPLLPDIIHMLKGVKEAQVERMIKCESLYEDHNLVFCGRTGRPTDPKGVESRMAKLAAKTNIKGLHTHCLRHTFATRCLENGVELRVVQELLGHSSIQMTANIYTHVLPDKKKDSIMKLDGTFKLF